MKEEILKMEAIAAGASNHLFLKDIWLHVFSGEIAGITGLHNLSKEIFIQILTERYPFSSGKIYLSENRLSSDADFIHLKNQTVYLGNRFLSLDKLSIAENLSLFSKPHRTFGIINKSKSTRLAQEMLTEIGLNISPNIKMESLSEQDRLLLEIFSTIFNDRKLIICDSSLRSLPLLIEKNRNIVCKMLKKRGSSLLLLSDDLKFLTEICTSLTVTREGYTTNYLTKDEFNSKKIVHQIDFPLSYHWNFKPNKTVRTPGREVLKCEDLALPITKQPAPFTFSVHQGELVGLCSMNTEQNRSLAEILAGVEPKYSGKIFRNGALVSPAFFTRQCCAKNKMYVLFGNNEAYAFFPNLSPEENCVFSSLKKFSGFMGYLDRSIYRYANLKLKQLKIIKNKKLFSHDMSEFLFKDRFSIIMERIKLFAPELMVFLNPTDGLDLESKNLVLSTCSKLAEKGTGILFISHNRSEMRSICDKTLYIDENGCLIKL